VGADNGQGIKEGEANSPAMLHGACSATQQQLQTQQNYRKKLTFIKRSAKYEYEFKTQTFQESRTWKNVKLFGIERHKKKLMFIST
jgi:hypothetical protein